MSSADEIFSDPAQESMASRPEPGTTSRVLVVLGATFQLLICSVIAEVLWTRSDALASAHLGGPHFLEMMIVPVSAALLFLSVSVAIPSLFAVRRLKFPLNLTLPVVYGVILHLCALLWSRGPSPIVRIEFLEAATQFWRTPKVAISLMFLQIAMLSFATLAGSISKLSIGLG